MQKYEKLEKIGEGIRTFFSVLVILLTEYWLSDIIYYSFMSQGYDLVKVWRCSVL